MPKKYKNELSLNYKIERSNQLNTFTPKGWNLTEIRFLAIYQAKINARNPETRTVKFSLEEFCEIMEIKRLNITPLRNIINSLICKPVTLPNDRGGFDVMPLFSKCSVYNSNNEWFVDIRCSQEVLPYMFEMKRNYFTYELWNALSLTSVNQIRMYEILKQYEKIGERIITIEELKRMLDINKNQYSRYQDFRIKVLEPCQKALEKRTDIRYTFEPIKQGRKIHALKFTITKNKDFKGDLKLKEFIKPEDLEDIMDTQEIISSIDGSTGSVIESLYYRCNEDYTINQLEMIYNYVENSGAKLNVNTENYIYSVYCKIKIEGNKVNNLFKYTFAIIEKQVNDYIFNVQSVKENESKKQELESNFDLEEWKRFSGSTKRIMHD